jgi:hypothetical protein
MAEQSMFWPTTGTGDGVSGGYTDARLKTIWKAALGNGVLQYLNNLAATGTGTSTLAVNTGAALVEGYLYENDTSASIATASLGSATYGLYVIANEDASALTVSRSVAGTTIGAKTTRLALNSTTPTQPYIKIATVVTSGGSITSITAENNRYATSRVKTVGSSTLAVGTRTTNQSIANNTSTVITFGSVTNSDYVTGVAGTGVFTIKESGIYSLQGGYAFAYNATGERSSWVAINAAIQTTTLAQFTATAAGTSSTRYLMATQFELVAGDTVEFYAYQSSGGALNLSIARCTIARLG